MILANDLQKKAQSYRIESARYIKAAQQKLDKGKDAARELKLAANFQRIATLTLQGI